MRPGTNEAWISDTGWNTWEEVNRVVNPTAGVTNFGWPCYEGNAATVRLRQRQPAVCETLYTAPAGTHTAPFVAWNHSSKLVAGRGLPDRQLVVDRRGVLPDQRRVPTRPRTNGAVFFADYSRGCIWAVAAVDAGRPARPGEPADVRLRRGQPGRPRGRPRRRALLRRPRAARSAGSATSRATSRPMRGHRRDADAGPGAADRDASTAPAPPTPTRPTTGRLTYAWDFTNDGTTDSTVADGDVHLHRGGHVHRAADGDRHAGATDTATVTITPGNEAPTAVIDTPVAGTTWKVGDTITFSGHATDPQQGTLPASALDVAPASCSTAPTPDNCHTHAIQNWTGVASGSFVAPDHEYPSYLELELVATDQQGLTHTVVRRLDPQTVDLTFASNPSGLQLTVGSSSARHAVHPYGHPGLDQLGIRAVAADLRRDDYTFSAWSDGGAQTHVITAPTAATTYTATYTAAPTPQPIGYTQVGARPTPAT